MKSKIAAALLGLALALPAPARAQVQLEIHLGLPVAPPLVVVQPGIQVVQDYDDEVFVYGGGYWLRRGRYWYRAPRPGAAFVHVQPQVVPVPLMRLPPGRYVRYRHPPLRRSVRACGADQPRHRPAVYLQGARVGNAQD